MGKVLMYEKLTKKFLLVFSLIEPFRRIALRGGILVLLVPLMSLLIVLSFPCFAFTYLLSKRIGCGLRKVFLLPIATWWIILFGLAWLLTGQVPVQVPLLGVFWISSIVMGGATIYFVKSDS